MGGRQPITAEQRLEKFNGRATAQKPGRPSGGRGGGEETSSFACSSLSLSLSQQTAGTEPWKNWLLAVATESERASKKERERERGEEKRSCLTAAGFEGHLKNTTRQSGDGSIFSLRQGTQVLSPLLSLARSPLTAHPFCSTTAKSIEMTTLLEGHRRALPALWWNALWLRGVESRWGGGKKNKKNKLRSFPLLAGGNGCDCSNSPLSDPYINMQNGAEL